MFKGDRLGLLIIATLPAGAMLLAACQADTGAAAPKLDIAGGNPERGQGKIRE